MSASGVAFAAPEVQSERLWLGSAWYPEQWPEDQWAQDLKLMQDHGANVVRIAEFAWSRMEPTEGQYDMSWMVRAVRLAATYGLKTVIGTPTDTPPAWMSQKYPDILRIDESGRAIGHGGRRQFSISSPRYRDFCRTIVTKMAEALGKDPNIIGWQIGNEYTDESYGDDAKQQWAAWLKAKYGTLERLNEVWTTAYWSQTYSSWDQVPLKTSGQQNPGLLLDAKRFITATWVDFQKVQVDALRKLIAPSQFITTNLGGLGWANKFDRFAINRDLDFASWDEYVGSGHLKPDRMGATHDLVRGWKRKNFWVMETQPGYVNWAGVSNMLYPGETRALAWQAVGHGADAVLYWQWRNALNGQETLHGSIIGPDGKPLPIYDEIKQIGSEFAKTSKALAGTVPVSEVAILQSYDSRWAIDYQMHHKDYDQIEVLLGYYRPLKAVLGAVDMSEVRAPLDRYKLVVAPSLNVISEADAQHLTAYVRNGGHLILGPRSGLKDEFNRLHVVRQPGPLAGLLGAQVEQYYTLDETIAVEGGTATIWAEDLTPKAADTEVRLRYGKANGWLDGKAAVVTRMVGQGRITYFGALFDAATTNRLIDAALTESGVTRSFAVPDKVELMTRRAGKRRVHILVNHSREPRQVTLPDVMTDALNGGATTAVTLPPLGVAVLAQS
nr:beta-galactosidase [Asticcacaulis aquaticus]